MSAAKTAHIVYVVDDDFAVCDSLSVLIQASGYSVKSFLSAKEFLDNYDNKLPGCLILDVRMQPMSGLELQDNLLARKIEIPIIFISGHSRVLDSSKAFRSGAIEFLEKPFDNDILLIRIEEALKSDLENRAKTSEYDLIKQRMASLTLREKDVLICIVKGYSNKETATMLDISCRTIEIHRSRVMKKMQVQHFSELMIMLKEQLM